MRILTVIENYNPFIVGGAEVTVEAYINFISSGYDVEYRILTGTHTKSRKSKKNPIIKRCLLGVSGQKVNFIIELSNILLNLGTLTFNLIQFRPDIIEFVPNNYSLYPLIFFATIIKYPLVISIHNSAFSEKTPSFLNWLNLLKIDIVHFINSHSNTLIITISEFMKKSLVKTGINSERIAVLYNPIETNYEESVQGDYAVFASRLVEEKGVRYILEAFTKLYPIKLHVYGDGTQKELVEKYSKKHKNIIYFGKVSEDEVLSSISKSLLIIAHPVFEEPFGRYIIHSYSTLKPLICSYSGAVSELIENRRNGILVQKEDVAAIVSSVKELASNKILYQKIVNNLKEERKKFNISFIAKKRLKILSQKI